ncbi:MAG: type II toxin-antitoxin system VapC family toxin [Candidatus Dormibacteraeota bacterium]|uniref:Type II toxin-antitoxin system VapC family toxin n=1 Tax=Candidatus Amunia macphersoniae TaxID=3127014 RepID=A0A934KKH4_9BACT|nr:type II toxin-antitoxin system VapC family toxin [Candidatus Dormibacteraeota bacterium]
MATYVDTSAVLRLVERRGDVSPVESAMAAQPLCSSLGELECWSAIHKKWHDAEVTLVQRDQLLSSVQELLDAVNIMALDDDVLEEARTLCRRYPLRTLDGIHLATASRADSRLAGRSVTLRFCTADRRQAEAARQHFGQDRVDFVPSWR